MSSSSSTNQSSSSSSGQPPTSSSSSVSSSSSSSSSPITVDISIEGVADDKEESIAGLVVRRADGNNAPRRKITLDSTATTGNVVLTFDDTKVSVYLPGPLDVEIVPGDNNTFPVSDLPTDLYVQGDVASASMRDVELQLNHDEVAPAIDKVKFTVLWVSMSARHDNDVSDDNSSRLMWLTIGIPPSDDLGHRLMMVPPASPSNFFNTRGSEFIGTVSPNNFVPRQFDGKMNLEREVVSGKVWWGANGNENSETIPAQPDTSDSLFRDDDPQSGDSNGTIYDLDAPGVSAHTTLQSNIIWRIRCNFLEWAVYEDAYNEIGGDPVRCSEKLDWYTRQSYKLTGSFETGTATGGGANTLTDTNQNWTANEWAPGGVWIIAGTGKNQFRRITGNTADTITVVPNWIKQPDGTSQYRIINTSTWTQVNDVNDDNVNRHDAGTTNTSWNLQ